MRAGSTARACPAPRRLNGPPGRPPPTSPAAPRRPGLHPSAAPRPPAGLRTAGSRRGAALAPQGNGAPLPHGGPTPNPQLAPVSGSAGGQPLPPGRPSRGGRSRAGRGPSRDGRSSGRGPSSEQNSPTTNGSDEAPSASSSAPASVAGSVSSGRRSGSRHAGRHRAASEGSPTEKVKKSKGSSVKSAASTVTSAASAPATASSSPVAPAAAAPAPAAPAAPAASAGVVPALGIASSTSQRQVSTRRTGPRAGRAVKASRSSSLPVSRLTGAALAAGAAPAFVRTASVAKPVSRPRAASDTSSNPLESLGGRIPLPIPGSGLEQADHHRAAAAGRLVWRPRPPGRGARSPARGPARDAPARRGRDAGRARARGTRPPGRSGGLRRLPARGGPRGGRRLLRPVRPRAGEGRDHARRRLRPWA